MPHKELAVIDESGKAVTAYAPTEALEPMEFVHRRKRLLEFIGAQLVKGETRAGKLVSVNDYYEVPGAKGQLALSKKGAEMLAQFHRLAIAESRVVDQVLTAEFVSVRSRCAVHRNGVVVGEKEAAANTAEKAFQSPWNRMKYGAKWSMKQDERGQRVPDKETSPPDLRGAQHELVMKSQKRAFVGATIVALAATDILVAADALDVPEWSDDEMDDSPEPIDPPTPASRGGPTAEQLVTLMGLLAHPIHVTDDERTETAKWLNTPEATEKSLAKLLAKLEARLVGAAEEKSRPREWEEGEPRRSRG